MSRYACYHCFGIGGDRQSVPCDKSRPDYAREGDADTLMWLSATSHQ